MKKQFLTFALAVMMTAPLATTWAVRPAKTPSSIAAEIPDAGPWALLGKRMVNFTLDHDAVAATGQGLFTGVKIKVKGGALNMHRVVVHFANGEQQEFELRNNFAPGTESRVLDLPGNKRVISHVTLWYDSKNAQAKRAVVEVWGRR